MDEYEQYLREVAVFAQRDGAEAHHTPAYAQPNGSVGLGGCESYEQDVIREAYSSATYTSLRDLPNQFRPGEVALARQLKAADSHRPALLPEDSIRARQRQQQRVGGLFHQFEYLPSSYTLKKEMDAQERLDSKARALEIGGGRDFVCPGTGARSKFEDGFGDESYRFPYQSDPYDARAELDARERMADKSKVLFGPFKPSGRVRRDGADLVTRLRLPEMVETIRETLLQDWGDCFFEVKATADELVVVRFDLMRLEGQLRGVRAYMNMLESTNADVSRFGLRKSGSDWNKQPGDGFVYFFLRPPWLKHDLVGAQESCSPQDFARSLEDDEVRDEGEE